MDNYGNVESRKRKRSHGHHSTNIDRQTDTSKPTATFRPSGARTRTVSVALPSSIVGNAHTHDQKSALVGTVARALAIFCVDEIVIFEDGFKSVSSKRFETPENRRARAEEDRSTGYTAFSDPADFMIHILSYLETPPYLRRALMPFHPNLKSAGMLPSLDMPHHLRVDEWCQYREGVAVENFAAPNLSSNIEAEAMRAQVNAATLVDAGLPNKVTIPISVPANTRITLKFDHPKHSFNRSQHLTAAAVSPETPRHEEGYYWGYATRLASSLGKVFTESPFEGGYDFCIGTSERGKNIVEMGLAAHAHHSLDVNREIPMPEWTHLLVVFGGVAGLEFALSSDTELVNTGVKSPSELFDEYINIADGQGSRTIRTEEALFIGLGRLQNFIRRNETS